VMEKISSVLFSLYRGTPKHGEWVVACLSGIWPGLLGERLSRACRPLAFQHSTLTIGFSDSIWEEPLRSVESELLIRFRQATGDEVRALAWKHVDR